MNTPISEDPIDNKLNKEHNYNIEDLEDTRCPVCKKNRFWLKFYGGKTLLRCEDCGHFEEI